MIHTSLELAAKYEGMGLGSRFRKAFTYLQSLQATVVYKEREIEIIPGEVIATIMVRNGRASNESPLEYHRRFADIHLCLAGSEQIGWRDDYMSLTPSAAFNEEGDFGLLLEPFADSLRLNKGQLAIFFPEEPHAPLIGEGVITKVCVKVLVGH